MAASTLIGEVGDIRPSSSFTSYSLKLVDWSRVPPEDRPDRLAFARFLRERTNAGARGGVAWPTAVPRTTISGA
jgi:hypothetical protein